MVTAFHPPSTQHINGAQAAESESRSPSREIWSWRCRRMSSFRTSQQTELHRHVESLSAACWMPHTTRGGGCRHVECVQTGVQSAATKNTVLVADDTDLIILLCYYADPDGFDMCMQCSTRGTTKKNRIWDIKVNQCELGADICNNILFIHAILGCDTTSRLYGLGKGLSLKRFTSSPLFRDKAEQFCKKDATVDAGEAALMCLYSGKEGDYLDGLRYAKFCDKVATNTAYPSSDFAPDLCSSEIPQYASIPADTAVVGCLQYGGDWLGVVDKGREPRPCYDGPSSSTRRTAPCLQMQLHNWLQHSQMQLSQAESGMFPCIRSVPTYRMIQQHRGWYQWRRRRRWWWWQIVRCCSLFESDQTFTMARLQV